MVAFKSTRRDATLPTLSVQANQKQQEWSYKYTQPRVLNFGFRNIDLIFRIKKCKDILISGYFIALTIWEREELRTVPVAELLLRGTP